MGIATDMKNLGHEIVSSYDVRRERVAALARDTADMLKGFHKAHKEMAEELREGLGLVREGLAEVREGLAKGEATRLKEHAGMMKGIQTRQKEREGEVKGMLSAFRDEREKMAAEWQKMAAEWQTLTSIMANRRGGRYKPGSKGEMGEEAAKPVKKTGRRRRRG